MLSTNHFKEKCTLKKLSLIAIVTHLSVNASLVEASPKLSKEELIAEIRKLEETITSVEPKVEWFRKDMENKVYEGPFTKEAEKARLFTEIFL